MINSSLGDVARRTGDVVSWGVILGAFTDNLPAIATFFSLLWTVIQVSDWAWRKLRARRAEDGA